MCHGTVKNFLGSGSPFDVLSLDGLADGPEALTVLAEAFKFDLPMEMVDIFALKAHITKRLVRVWLKQSCQ